MRSVVQEWFRIGLHHNAFPVFVFQSMVNLAEATCFSFSCFVFRANNHALKRRRKRVVALFSQLTSRITFISSHCSTAGHNFYGPHCILLNRQKQGAQCKNHSPSNKVQGVYPHRHCKSWSKAPGARSQMATIKSQIS